MRSVVKENQLMEAAIIKVDKARFELKLSLRKSDTQPNPDKVGARYIDMMSFFIVEVHRQILSRYGSIRFTKGS